MQVRMSRSADFSLKNERLGPLPLINHFIDRMGLGALLDKHVPTTDPRCRVSPAKALGVLLRSIVVVVFLSCWHFSPSNAAQALRY
jgi:hypothetical protein